jgi:alpha-methylacyl-CoA racemase
VGPLQGINVVEIASLGPGPFCGMLLADLGAEVVKVERPRPHGLTTAALERGRRSICLDLKTPDGAGVLLRLAARADVVIEGFRPGVAERLGVSPAECLAANPRLVYGRATGWGREGPLADDAGHDIGYLALAGGLWPLGRPDRPPDPPLNMVADFGGGGMLLALGVVAALLERERSGMGQVVDAAIVDGVALQTTLLRGMTAEGTWVEERGNNLIDGAAPFYAVYEASDGGYLAVGALEPQFYLRLLEILGLDPDELPDRHDKSAWPSLREAIAGRFLTRTRDEWAEAFAGEDACAAPVLAPSEASHHPQLASRNTFVEEGGWWQPAPAPRFSRTPLGPPQATAAQGADADEVLGGLGYTAEEIEALRRAGTVL